MNKLTRLILAACLTAFVAACSSQSQQKPLIISAIPDHTPEVLQPIYSDLASFLEQKLGIPVKYQAVTTYDEALDLFRLGKIDLVYFGGLTGVQAVLRVKGAKAIIQRDIDKEAQSIFIANVSSQLKPIDNVADLQEIKGHSFTFGGVASTSGYLMPQYFFEQANVHEQDFRGPVFFTGSHDKTIDVVEAGDYEAGVVNSQIWNSRVKSGKVDLNKVVVLWKSPAFADNHWVIHPNAVTRFGSGFVQRLQGAFFTIDSKAPLYAEILGNFGAQKFVATKNEDYIAIEAVARELGYVQD